MISKFLMRQEAENQPMAVTKNYLHFDINVSELYPMNDENKRIVTIEFGNMEEVVENGKVVSEGGKVKRFSFEVPELVDPDSIYALANTLHVGINNTLTELFKRKE